MSAMYSQITGVLIIYLAVCSGADQRKHQSSASLAFVRGSHRWMLNSPCKGPVTRKMFPLMTLSYVLVVFDIHYGSHQEVKRKSASMTSLTVINDNLFCCLTKQVNLQLSRMKATKISAKYYDIYLCFVYASINKKTHVYIMMVSGSPPCESLGLYSGYSLSAKTSCHKDPLLLICQSNLILTWIRNFKHYRVWDQDTHPF